MKSASDPVVEANSFASTSPAITTSSSSHWDHVEPGPNVERIGLARYGTGFDGSDTYASNALSGFVAGGASNASLPPEWKYSLRAVTSRLGGQLSYERHSFAPDSNVVASARSSLPLSLSQ